ncbi:dienelactone hydrolase family protein [Hansschlegelia plantiphila]|uniref:Carboxymethylenebutenolidase n=1 Tax=Hansschlegelia plantiphila TaxID=374655 RepID=A0A9W6IY20_9HYPH|nr:dienelactone hydrolase family protein [Hansschlegelia plantiphila]GLK67246.1 carboxymethylenebutenolidase [Hansschlegelia plantiphila]
MTKRPPRNAIALYDRYTHGEIGRRAFFERLVGLAGSVAAANAVLSALSNDYARAAIVAPDDKRLAVEMAAYEGPDGPVSGMLARGPGGGVKRPAVIVVHENRGLNPHIQDVTRRLAVSGFLAFGVDLLSPLGGTPPDEDKAREMIGALDLTKTTASLAAAVPFLEKHPESNGSVGVVGFCWGGGMANRLAVAAPDLKAAVAYYGQTLDAEQAAEVKAPLLLHYAGLDERIDAGVPAFEAALKSAGKDYQLFMYEGVDHAFNNDTNPARYDKKAAALAWDRTIAFLEQHLGAAVPPLP